MTHRVLAAAVATLVACGGGGAANTVEPVNQAELLPIQIAYQGLCDARTLAEAGDVQGAADTFQSQVHEQLHMLAEDLAATDRKAAGRLLEAKQIAESMLANPAVAVAPVVADQLTTLEQEVANAAGLLGLDRPTCGAVGT